MLLMTLGLFAVLWFVVLGFANSSVQALRQARQQVSGEQAQWTAEAGLKLALQALAKDSTYTPKGGWVSMAHNSSSKYEVVVYDEKKSPVAIPTGCLYVLSTGMDASGAERRMAAVVKLGSTAKSLLNYSVFANTLNITGGSKIDSFDSTVGPSARGSSANVATNSVTPGSISLSGGAYIRGTIQVGPGGKVGAAKPTTPTTKTSNVVWKDWSTWSLAESAMDQPLEFPKVATPAPGTTDLKVNYKGATLAPGAYGDLRANGGGEVKLSGGTYVFKSLKINGGAKLTFSGTTPAIIYVVEDFDMSNGTLYNPSSQPRNMVFMVGKDVKSKFTGGAQAFAVIYGPEADFDLVGGSDLFGAIVGRTVDIKGGAGIHYDTDLIKNPPSVLATGSSGTGTTVISMQRL
jgi:hypothetical protein